MPAGAATGPVTRQHDRRHRDQPDTFTVSGGPPPPALVQHAVGSGTKGTQASATWPQPTAAGDLLVATIGWTGTGDGDARRPGGRSPSPPAPPRSTTGRTPRRCPGSSTFSISATANWVLSLSEWSGMAASGALDRTAHASGGATAATTASSGTTATTVEAGRARRRWAPRPGEDHGVRSDPRLRAARPAERGREHAGRLRPHHRARRARSRPRSRSRPPRNGAA